MGQKKVAKVEKDGLGPGAYAAKAPGTAPHLSFGMNLTSDITSMNHIRPNKTDIPGPGNNTIPDVQFKHPTTKFSKDRRKDLARREQYPAPNNYEPKHETEPVLSYSFPKGNRLQDPALSKSNVSPGPCAYNIRNDDKMQGMAKSILGGPQETKGIQDNGVPGPGAYQPHDQDSVPGFKIMLPLEPVKEDPKKNDPNY